MYDENHPRLAMGRVNLAMVLRDRGKLAQADSLFAISVGPIVRALGPDHSAAAVTDCYLGSLRLAEGRLAVADSLLSSGSQRLVGARGKQSPHLARALEQLARVRHARGDTASAGALFRRARDIWAALGAADDHPDLAAVKLGLGRLALERNDLATAEVLLRQAHDTLARNLAPDHRQTLLAANALGAALVRMGRRDEGAALLDASHDRLLADPGLEPFDRAAVVRWQGLLAMTAGR
jgi:tetratricopeptide (TPR) repeat protein